MAELDLITVKAEAEQRVRGWVDAQIAAIENNLGAHGAAYLEADEAAALGPEFLDDTDALLRVAARVDHERNFRPTIASLLSGGMAQARPFLAPAMKSACAEIGLSGDLLEGPTGPTIERVLLRGLASLFDEKLAIEAGAIEPLPRAAAPAQPAPAAPAPAPEKPFFAYWETFVDDKRTQKDWKPDMPGNARSARNTFEGLIGDPPPTQFTWAAVSDYRTGL